jgi:tetrahydromethanopterin S-methyltransferase subunit H
VMQVSILFDYATEQKTLIINGVKIGGLPGKIPTASIASIFYTRDRLVKNAQSGEFDKSATENILSMLVEMTEKTGIPTMLDVVATTPDAMKQYLQYLVDNCDFPLLIDGSDSVAVNSAGIQLAKESGFLERVIINSLTPSTSDELYQIVTETGLQNALLLAFSTNAMVSITKRVELADNLLQKAQEAGITNILIDTGVMDIPSLGIACKAQMILKNKYGYPVGNGAHNAISTWRGLVPKFGKKARVPALVGASLMPVVLGADFVLLGPAKYASVVYPSIAMIDTA